VLGKVVGLLVLRMLRIPSVVRVNVLAGVVLVFSELLFFGCSP